MTPGRDLDLLIARKVLGWVVLLDSSTQDYRVKDQVSGQWIVVPHYSTSTTDAHQLMSIFKNAGCSFHISSSPDGKWNVSISHSSIPGIGIGGSGNSLSHGICEAILQFNALFKIKKN